MTELVWIVAAVIGLTLLQVILFRYIRGQRGASVEASGLRGSTQRPVEERSAGGDASGVPGEGRRCPDCGATNAMGFTFCRNCVARLGA